MSRTIRLPAPSFSTAWGLALATTGTLLAGLCGLCGYEASVWDAGNHSTDAPMRPTGRPFGFAWATEGRDTYIWLGSRMLWLERHMTPEKRTAA